ncbi:MAG: agmatine deiminase [Campylobacterota bacterium]|nr:agmatine deiminase [Campylobacterota bacterium]
MQIVPEWAEQSSVLVVVPPRESDWSSCFEEVVEFYINLIKLMSQYGHITVTATDDLILKELPKNSNISAFKITTNDTWVRDFGPITVIQDNKPLFLDFGFNGWGLKFASNYDNQFTKELKKVAFFEYKYNLADIILEGGSIEYDGNGTIMTTSECLLSPNRNPHLSKEDINKKLKEYFGVQNILWVNHGYLAGDYTDSHIDTLARFCPENTIAYVQCLDVDDEHYQELFLMQEELKSFKNIDGKSYNLVPLPMTRAIYDEDDYRLPATYANFLIMNSVVIMPTYNDPNDELAKLQLQKCFKDKEVVTIDCSVLIKQHGSLHCSTMQIPKG